MSVASRPGAVTTGGSVPLTALVEAVVAREPRVGDGDKSLDRLGGQGEVHGGSPVRGPVSAWRAAGRGP